MLGAYGLQSFSRLVIRKCSGYRCSSSSSKRNGYRIRRFLGSSSSHSNNFEISSLHQEDENVLTRKSPWNNTLAVMKIKDIISSRKDSSQKYQQQQQMKTKFRQHVNPLKVQFQLPCDLPSTWPRAAYTTCLSKPLFVDIGCGKGGFLLKLAAATAVEEELNKDPVVRWNQYNFLGIEIRPSVVEYAQLRCSKQHQSGRLSFVGCNVNVDLDRLLHRYMLEASGQPPNQPPYETATITNTTPDDDPSRVLTPSFTSSATTTTRIQPIVGFVSIQFPDPHFKKRHKKRKVVDESLVITLAQYTTLREAQIFLQSDIQEVVDDMRQSIREYGSKYFDDITTKATITTTTGTNSSTTMTDYLQENPIGIPTEREISVLERGLPVYRCLFQRNDVPFTHLE